MRTELEVKYDILRGDYYRLERKLEYYESGKAFESLKAKYEKEIKKLQNKLSMSESSYKRMSENNNKNITENARLRRIISEKDSELQDAIKEYEGMLDEYKNLIDELRRQINDLEGTIKKMSAQLNRDYTNSSIPSSKDENHKKISNSREKSGRLPGGQKGHKGSLRRPMEPTEPVIKLVPQEVTENPEDWEEMEIKRVRQVIDAHMEIRCVQYEAHAYRNKQTKQIIYSAFPANAVNEVNYGEGIKALCCLLPSYCNVSIRKTAELIRSLTDNRLNISTGMIAGLPKELKDKTEEDRKEIKHRLMCSPVLHSDATGIRINGEKWNIYVTANDRDAVYTLSKVKGVEGIKATPLKNYVNAVIHDHDRSYYNEEFSFKEHQECLAHIIRYCQDSIDNEPELTWNSRMKKHLQWIIHRYKEKNITEDEREVLIQTYDEILDTAEKEYRLHPPAKYYREGFNLAKRLKAYRNETLAFLTSETELEYDNNLSERLLRQCKRKSKAVISFRDSESTETYCDVLSLIKSADQQGINIYQMMKEGFSRTR
jgi:hypothetical protein